MVGFSQGEYFQRLSCSLGLMIGFSGILNVLPVILFWLAQLGSLRVWESTDLIHWVFLDAEFHRMLMDNEIFASLAILVASIARIGSPYTLYELITMGDVAGIAAVSTFGTSSWLAFIFPLPPLVKDKILFLIKTIVTLALGLFVVGLSGHNFPTGFKILHLCQLHVLEVSDAGISISQEHVRDPYLPSRIQIGWELGQRFHSAIFCGSLCWMVAGFQMLMQRML